MQRRDILKAAAAGAAMIVTPDAQRSGAWGQAAESDQAAKKFQLAYAPILECSSSWPATM